MIQAPYCAAVDFRFSCNEGNQVSWKQSYYQIVSKRIRFNFGPVIFLNAIAMHFLLFYRDKAAKKIKLGSWGYVHYWWLTLRTSRHKNLVMFSDFEAFLPIYFFSDFVGSRRMILRKWKWPVSLKNS